MLRTPTCSLDPTLALLRVSPHCSALGPSLDRPKAAATQCTPPLFCFTHAFISLCAAACAVCRHAVTIDGYEDVPKDNEHALKQAASQQPIAVGICASPAMQFYGGGVIDTCCEELNHGVLLVGYGTDQKTNTDYWLVKNSWGGEEGLSRKLALLVVVSVFFTHC